MIHVAYWILYIFILSTLLHIVEIQFSYSVHALYEAQFKKKIYTVQGLHNRIVETYNWAYISTTQKDVNFSVLYLFTHQTLGRL